MILPLAIHSAQSERSLSPVGAQRRRGIAAVELAVLAPFLAGLVVGMCELGRGVMVRDILTDAARKGCRTGAMAGKGYQDVINDVNNILTDNSIATGNATITIQIASYTGNATTPSWGAFTTVSSASAFKPNPLDQIAVQVSVTASTVLWFSPVYISRSIVSQTLIMVKQG
jgi:Flp pilus assembly protein TadG